MTSVEWVNDVVGHQVGPELNRMEAEQVTAKIKSYVGVAWVLLYEAHQRKAHKAMGYETWAEYVAAEFDMSRSRSYQLISQARMVIEISAAVSTDVDITEAEARDLAGHAEEAKQAASDAADALGEAASAAERAEAAKQAVEEVRFTAVERARQRREAEAAARSAAGQNADGEITSGSEPREDQGGSGDEGAPDDEGAGSTSPEPAPSDPDAGYRKFIDTALVRLCDVRQMDPERVQEVATTEQRRRIASNVAATREWCDRMDEALSARPNLKVAK